MYYDMSKSEYQYKIFNEKINGIKYVASVYKHNIKKKYD